MGAPSSDSPVPEVFSHLITSALPLTRDLRLCTSAPFRRFWLAAKRSGVRIPLGPLPQVRRHRSNVLQLLDDSLNDLAHFLLRDAKHFGDLAGRHSLVDEERENDLLPLLER
jgi:hypothetical protein